MENHFYTTLGELSLVLLFFITHVRLLRNANVLNFGTYPNGEQTRQYNTIQHCLNYVSEGTK